MSKLVKGFVTRDIASRLSGVEYAVVVNVVGLGGNDTYELRKQLREKNVDVMVVKRTMAARATEGTSLRPAFNNVDGSVAVVWGAEDFVGLAREITEVAKSGKFKQFEIKGGVMDSESLTGEQVKAISKWPSRTEQISLLVGQILSPGSTVAGQLKGPASKIAGQLKTIYEADEPA